MGYWMKIAQTSMEIAVWACNGRGHATGVGMQRVWACNGCGHATGVGIAQCGDGHARLVQSPSLCTWTKERSKALMMTACPSSLVCSVALRSARWNMLPTDGMRGY
jgi:hypothetical protein